MGDKRREGAVSLWPLALFLASSSCVILNPDFRPNHSDAGADAPRDTALPPDDEPGAPPDANSDGPDALPGDAGWDTGDTADAAATDGTVWDGGAADGASTDGAALCVNASDCEDGLDCTVHQCLEGVCLSTFDDSRCDDLLDCTDDLCSAGGCQHVPNDARCLGAADDCRENVGCVHALWVDRGCGDSCGSGTPEAPFATIEEALGATVTLEAGEWNLVWVAAGRYSTRGLVHDAGRRPLWIEGVGAVEVVANANTAFVVESSAQVVVQNVIWSAARQTAVLCRSTAQCTFLENQFVDNGYFGLEIAVSARATVERCFFSNNGRGALKLADSGQALVRNCLLVGNGGTGTEVGAISVPSGGTLQLVSSTVADNECVWSEGVIVGGSGSTVEIISSIFWNNSTSRDRTPEQLCVGCTFDASSLRGDVDPLFVRSTARVLPEDYRIAAESPAVDSGGSSPLLPAVDYWGDPRDSCCVDVGSDEVVP